MKNKKSLGQHWLKDRDILMQIAHLAKPQNTHPDEPTFAGTVLEIGPGLGTLTSALLKHFDNVISVEFDPELATKLPAQFPGKNLKVITADFLDLDLTTIPTPYTVAGNIPYYITAPIIKKLLALENKPSRIVLLVQKEVAERLAAKAGDYSILALSAQIYAKVSLGPPVPRHLFTPPPKVDSQVIIFDPYPTPLATEKVIALIKLGFSSPRKKLKNNLNLGENTLTALGIPENARPADLSIENWKTLAQFIHER